MDGGQVQWLLQQSIIRHIQTHDRSQYPNDNVWILSVVLGMANEYVRQLFAAYKAIDKAQKGGIIKKNTAARKKSRLAKALNK